ncbi:hypothetical protein AXF42_Ash016837 [Apostasia shenzhenica]|uniref:Uncharacterized protein n=1 Tax=Apostasia shenzhenica TaxID=1088818 RepID=A0A2I0BAJ5_9ASPA|nr:hypothetical protein AXF42_Ash016837 [Apostasia shenzhenica]
MIFSRGKHFFLLRTCLASQSLNSLSSLRFSPPFCFSSSSPATETAPSFKRPFIVDYLVKYVGLSPEQAIKASGSLSQVQSPSDPDAVRQFFKESGFSDGQIKKMVLKSSSVLMADVDTLLKPRMEALKEYEFSESDIIRLVSRVPIFLFCSDTQLKRINFWRKILQTKDLVLKALLRARGLIFIRPDRNVMPKVQFLRNYGFSKDDIAYMVGIQPTLIALGLDRIKSLVKQVEELQIPVGSRAFSNALIACSQLSRATLDSKLNLFRNLGRSEAEIWETILKSPQLLTLSVKKIKENMEFLVNAGYETSYVMERPLLLCYSLEKRLIPRIHVLQFLKSKGLLKKGPSLCTILCFSEKDLMDKLIVPYEDEIPELRQVYVTALAGKFTM